MANKNRETEKQGTPTDGHLFKRYMTLRTGQGGKPEGRLFKRYMTPIGSTSTKRQRKLVAPRTRNASGR